MSCRLMKLLINGSYVKIRIALVSSKLGFRYRLIWDNLTYFFLSWDNSKSSLFNPIQDGFFQGFSWMGEAKRPLPKICHTYLTMMKLGTVILYLNKFQKLYKSHDTPLGFCWHLHFLPEISKFCYIRKYRYRFHLDR